MNKSLEYLKVTPKPLRQNYFRVTFSSINHVSSCIELFSVEERVTTRERVLWTPVHIFQWS